MEADRARARPTTRDLMAATLAAAAALWAWRWWGSAYFAVLLAPGKAGKADGFLFLAMCLLVALAIWAALRKRPAAAAGVLLGAGGTTSGLLALLLLCLSYGSVFLGALVLFCGLPVAIGSGAAWALAPRPHGSRGPVWLRLALVIVSISVPASMMVDYWPFRLTFRASRPALDSLADQVAAGKPVHFPAGVGFFRVHACVIDPATGNIGLVDGPNPAGRSGFVRTRPAIPPGEFLGGPFWNLALKVDLGDGWWYVEED
jgi:hypothetical protein